LGQYRATDGKPQENRNDARKRGAALSGSGQCPHDLHQEREGNLGKGCNPDRKRPLVHRILHSPAKRHAPSLPKSTGIGET
jgi:hypothetical protein